MQKKLIMDYFKPTKAINPYGKLSRTIKSQYANTSAANFIRTGTFGATGAIKKWIKAEKDRNF